MVRRVVVVLVASGLLFAAAAWQKFEHLGKREIPLPELIRVIEDHPQAIVPGTLHLTGWIEGEIDGARLPAGRARALGLADGDPSRVRFLVVTHRSDNLEFRERLYQKRIRYSTGRIGARFYYRALFALGLLGVGLALALQVWERRARVHAPIGPAGAAALGPRVSRPFVAFVALALLLIGAAVVRVFTWKPLCQINVAVLRRVLTDRPDAILSGSLPAWGVFGEIQGGVLPPGDSGALGVADPGRRPTRFYVTNLTPQDAADLSAWLGPRGFRPTNKEPFIAVRFEGRTNLTIVLMAGWALLAALAMLVDDRRWRRRLAAGSGRPDARAWWRRWSLLMILAIGVLVLAVGVALIGQWVSMWTVALWMLASAALGLLGVAGLATGAALAIVRWRQGTGAQATPGWS